jgi:hypothetical protein
VTLVRPDVPLVVRRLTAAVGPPLAGREHIAGRWHAVWRWPCPACGIGEGDLWRRPLAVSGEGWFACDCGCDPEFIAEAIEMRELPTVVA